MELFGSPLRGRILTYLAITDDSYAREIADLFDAPLITVQRILRDFEAAALITIRPRGRTRLITLNPRWFAAAELRALLARLAQADSDLLTLATKIRRRPRQAGLP